MRVFGGDVDAINATDVSVANCNMSRERTGVLLAAAANPFKPPFEWRAQRLAEVCRRVWTQ